MKKGTQEHQEKLKKMDQDFEIKKMEMQIRMMELKN